MYTKTIPFKDFNGKPRNAVVCFNLTEREVMKNMVELKTILEWKDSISGEPRELETEEVVRFYNSFEEILLAAWGEPTEDGLHFRKAGRYDFEESALFNACMLEFVSNPEETGNLIAGIMPQGMENLVRKADENLALAESGAKDDDIKAELARLRKRLAEETGTSNA